VDETGDDVGVLQVEVVVLAEDVGGDDGGVVAPVLGLVHAVLDVDHALGVGVALVGEVRGTVVIMVSSIGKVVLSGKMQVERQDTSFCTPRL
jgi:hypothetical protein